MSVRRSAQRPPPIRDVAQHPRLSRASVYGVIDMHPYVRPEPRTAVQQSIQTKILGLTASWCFMCSEMLARSCRGV